MLNKTQLDEATARGCQNPECEHGGDCKVLFLHQRCCPGKKLEVSYRNESGVLRIGCVCGKVVAQIQVGG